MSQYNKPHVIFDEGKLKLFDGVNTFDVIVTLYKSCHMYYICHDETKGGKRIFKEYIERKYEEILNKDTLKEIFTDAGISS